MIVFALQNLTSFPISGFACGERFWSKGSFQSENNSALLVLRQTEPAYLR